MSSRHAKYFPSRRISQECKELMATLPKGKTFGGDVVYQYQGFWYLDISLQGVISCQQKFESRDSDIILVTSPKCGTTWLKAITFALLNRKQNPLDIPINVGHPLLNSNPHDLVPFLEISPYGHDHILDIASLPSPMLLATHIPYFSLPDSIKNSSSQCKFVYMARNPKDTFVSFWHYHLKLGKVSSIEEAFDYFCKGCTSYGPFLDHVLEYWKQSLQNPERVLFLKYEDMKVEPAPHLRRLADFLDFPFSAEEEQSGMADLISNLCSFDSLSNLHVNKSGKILIGVPNSFFFRRGEVQDWKNHLSHEMVEKINQLTQQKFSGWGLHL